MTCYFPLHAYRDKQRDKTVKIVFTRPASWRGEGVDLPCGQCVGCRLERSRQWAVRCMHEASLYEQNSFVTLTYSDQNLPQNGSLQLSDFQNFMKRLRKFIAPRKIRFYHCGEYGEAFKRPHYHALLFNYDFKDKVLFSQAGPNPVYISNELSKLWPSGHSVVGEVTFESAAYVARYVMKKVTGAKAKEFYGERKPEYTTMSRRPGIGAHWFEKYRGDVFPADRIVVRGSFSRPPRFYDNLLARSDPAEMALLKIGREEKARSAICEDVVNGRLVKESDNSDRRLCAKEVVKRAEIAALRRPFEEVG